MAAGKPASLLLVDDQTANLLALEAVLGDLGARLVRAGSGDEALARVAGEEFAAVILDVRMPGQSGFETARLIREGPHCSHLPIIFMTAADGDEFPVEEAYALGAVDYIAKPFSPTVLRAKVKFFIERFRDSVELKAAHERQSEERASQILESITDAFYALDRAWRFTFVNQRALDYFRIPREEVLGKVVWDLFPMIRGTAFEEEYRRAVTDQVTAEFEIESEFSHRWVEVRAYPTADGLACYFRDVTDRKRAEESAAAAHAQVELITNAVPALISYVDADRRYQLVNDTYEAWFGRPRAEVVGRHMQEVLGEGAWNAISPLLDQAFAGNVATYEGVLRYQHGGKRWVRAVYTPDSDDEGRVRGVVVLVNDLTDWKRAEDRQRFLTELALETQPLISPDEVTATTARLLADYLGTDRCAYAEVEDESVYVITGDYTRGVGSIVGRWPVVAFGEEHQKLMLANEPYVVDDADSDPRIRPRDIEAYRATAIQAVICVPLHKSGRFTAAMAVHQKTPRRWTPDEVHLVTTVTARCWEALERTRVARSLRQSEERLKLAVGIAQMGTFEIDLATDAVAVNEPGRVIYGWESTAITFAQVQTHFHPDDREEVMRRVTAALDPGGGGTFEVEQRIFRVDGEERWIKVRGLALFAGSGAAQQAVQLVGAYLDITDRKRTEEALQRQAAELRAQDQRKDQFIAMLAHELRNPLVPIRNAVHLLSLTREQETVTHVQEMVKRQVEHLAHIVDDLLDVSRVSTGKVELRRGRVDLAQVVSLVVSDLRRAFETAGVGLDLVVPDTPAWVDGDRTRLTQIADNLVSNALKFTDRGGDVSVSVRTDGTNAVFTVRDTGIGIEPDLLPRLFEPFTQADRSLDRTRGGLGLGLALVKGLTELQDGSVCVESEGAGHGTLFTVTLPSSHEPTSLSHRPAHRTPTIARRLRVLVVEDNLDAAESLRMLLKYCGCEVRVAHTGPDGVRTAVEMEPDLVLCDIGLPGLDGYGVARQLRQAFSVGKPVLVALTGYGEEDDKQRAAEAGFDQHYTKPVDPAVIQALLSTGA